MICRSNEDFFCESTPTLWTHQNIQTDWNYGKERLEEYCG